MSKRPTPIDSKQPSLAKKPSRRTREAKTYKVDLTKGLFKVRPPGYDDKPVLANGGDFLSADFGNPVWALSRYKSTPLNLLDLGAIRRSVFDSIQAVDSCKVSPVADKYRLLDNIIQRCQVSLSYMDFERISSEPSEDCLVPEELKSPRKKRSTKLELPKPAIKPASKQVRAKK